MGKLSRLIGLATQALDMDPSKNRTENPRPAQPASTPTQRTAPRNEYAPPPASASAPPASDADRAAIARYDYLLQTAEPHQIEQIHRDAFARLTPQQRVQVQERMRVDLEPHEQPASASPEHLARAAGRAEAARPGRVRTLLSRVRGRGAAGAVGGAAVGVLGAVAGGAVLSTVGAPLLEQASNLGVDFTALAEGVDLEALAGGFDVEGLAGAADGLVGSAGEAVSGLGDTASAWGERLGDLGLPGIRDLFGR
ncbi:cation-transporting ATPase [Microbacterium sp. NPDC087665]|uniref:cation-transporting ATPase n=1 Tax=Microbacterium sp. NPDC087665 TaxID=3364194 RepID=UPI003816F277